MLKQACPEEILNQVQNDTFRVQHDIFHQFTNYDTVSSWGRVGWGAILMVRACLPQAGVTNPSSKIYLNFEFVIFYGI
jgi:hypothetical protein